MAKAAKTAAIRSMTLPVYSKQSFEDSIAAAKALLCTKSVHEAFELQSGLAKTAFDAKVGEVAKLTEIVIRQSAEFRQKDPGTHSWAFFCFTRFIPIY